MKSITDETFDQVYNFLLKRVNPDAAKGFKKATNKAEWINKYWDALNEDSDWAETYKSKEDIFGNPSKTFPNLWEQYEGKILTDAQFDVLKKKYPWIRREELNDWFNKTNEYKDFYNEEAKKQAGINRRTKEVKDEWKLTGDNRLAGLIASEYERQRYINEPNEAIFGKEAPGWVGSSSEAKADAIAGGLATTADFVPNGFATFIGPTIRTGRDLFHYATNTKYKKDIDQIISDVKSDYITNLLSYGTANTRKAARLASAFADNDVRLAYNIASEGRAIKNGMEELGKLPVGTSLTDFKGAVNVLEDSPYKRDMLNALSNYTQEPYDLTLKKIRKVQHDYTNAINPNHNALMKEMVNNPNYKPPKLTSYEDAVISNNFKPSLKHPLKSIEYRALNLADALNVGKPGQMIFQGSADVIGRGGKVNVVQTAIERQEHEDTVERIKNNYSLLWSPNHKPQGYDNPIIKEAYDRWLSENGYIPGVN